MNIAYICLCHQDPKFISRVAKALNYKDDALFIHVDKKTDIEPFVKCCKGIKNVYFVQERFNTNWGGFNAIKATIATFKMAKKTAIFSRYMILQGQDYPLISNSDIHNFFESNKEKEFCKAIKIEKTKPLQYTNNDNRFLKKPINFFNKVFNFSYLSSKVKLNNNKVDIYCGWAQLSLTDKCVDLLIKTYETDKKYNLKMKKIFPPDETYFHTIIHNSVFKENLAQTIIFNRDNIPTLMNLTYFEYPDKVTEFKKKEDYSWLTQKNCIFVRKVNSESEELLSEIDRKTGRQSI